MDRSAWLAAACVAVALGCGGDTGGDVVDAGEIVQDLAVETVDAEVADTEVADAPAETLIPPITTPVPLRVGTGSRLLPVPVGIGTAGFFAPGDNEACPFTDNFQSTHGTYLPPDVRAVVVEGGPGRLVLARADLVGAFSTLREAVLRRVKERTGADLSNELILGATHTHSGPARFYTGALEFMSDTFQPEIFDRLVGAITDAVLDAFADLEPARFGFAMAQAEDLHSDRRCQNPLVNAPDLPLLRFDRLDGTTKALVLSHAIHGTVLQPSMHLLSEDAPGGIERKIAESFDHPVTVLFFNGWAADQSPNGKWHPALAETAYPQQGEMAWIEALGARAAGIVTAALPAIAMADAADVTARTVWAPIHRDIMGYKADEFPYDGGAICGLNTDGNCWVDGTSPNPVAGLDQACAPLEDDPPLWRKTPLTVARIGGLALVTFPGESTTTLGTDVRDDVAAALGGIPVAYLGYAQDFLFYSLHEWDWWQGGYEPSFSLWGPKQGDWLRARIAEVAKRFADPAAPLSFEPETAYDPPAVAFTPRVATPSLDAGVVVEDVQPAVSDQEIVAFAFGGGDPWLGTPEVTLEAEAGGAWAPVKRHDGTAMTSRGYEIQLAVAPDPAYRAAPKAAARRYVWTATVPLARGVPAVALLPAGGTYRLAARGTAAAADGTLHDVLVNSAAFCVGCL